MAVPVEKKYSFKIYFYYVLYRRPSLQNLQWHKLRGVISSERFFILPVMLNLHKNVFLMLLDMLVGVLLCYSNDFYFYFFQIFLFLKFWLLLYPEL